MPSLGLGTKTTNSGLITPGIVTDNLVLKHKYDAGSVIPVSDGAAYFDGTNDVINCGSDSSLDIGSSAFSVCCWAFLPGNTSDTLVAKGRNFTSSVAGFGLAFHGTNNQVYFDICNGSTRDAIYTSNDAWQANKWHHVAAVRPAGATSGRKIYVNGVDLTSASPNVVDDMLESSQDLCIGEASDGNYDLHGYVCNVGIWKDRVLTQPQIKSIMNKNYAGLTDSEKTSLVSWWNLDEGTGTTANDSHGSNNGTATNF